jgi:hypothetical protein
LSTTGTLASGALTVTGLGSVTTTFGIGTVTPGNFTQSASAANAEIQGTSWAGLIIDGSATTTGAMIEFQKVGTGYGYIGVDRAAGGGILSGSTADAMFISSIGAKDLHFGTNATVRATLLSGGMLGVNTTTASAARLYAYDNTATALPVAYFHQDNASATAAPLQVSSDAAGKLITGRNSFADSDADLTWGRETSFTDDSARVAGTTGWGVLTFSAINNANVALVCAGSVSFWAGTSPNCNIISSVTGSHALEVTTGALAGTTGNDAKLTISAHTDGVYIENRTGLTIQVTGFWTYG